MKTALLALSLILGASTVNASTTVTSCIGSIEEGRYGETMTVRREGNKLLVEGQYVNSRTVSFVLNSGTVKEDTATSLKVVNIKRTLAITTTKKSLVIDYTTGKGQLFVYQAGESLLKPRIIYLSSCTR